MEIAAKTRAMEVSHYDLLEKRAPFYNTDRGQGALRLETNELSESTLCPSAAQQLWRQCTVLLSQVFCIHGVNLC